jgi:hypothetical protein
LGLSNLKVISWPILGGTNWTAELDAIERVKEEEKKKRKCRKDRKNYA